MKKIFNLMLFAALLLVGACSDKETDEPDPVVKQEFPSEETFKKEIQNNLWEIVDWRYETEDGIDFPSDLWSMSCGGPFMPNLWYFWDDKAIMCEKTMYGDFGYRWSESKYDPATGILNGPKGLYYEKEVNPPYYCRLISLKDDILIIKYYIETFDDPGGMPEDWPEVWKNFPDRDKVINKAIYHVGTYKKVQNPDLKKVLSQFTFGNLNPDNFGIY